MMLKSQFTLILIFFIFGFTYSQTESENTSLKSKAEVEWKSYSKNDYRIDYPAKWTLDTSSIMGVTFALFSDLSGVSDKFRENVNLLIQDHSAYEMTLDQYVALSEEQIKTLVTDGNLILSERLKRNNREYQKVIYTGRQGMYELKFEQLYWIINKSAYVLTLTTESDQFDDFKEVGEAILKSFEIGNDENTNDKK